MNVSHLFIIFSVILVSIIPVIAADFNLSNETDGNITPNQTPTPEPTFVPIQTEEPTIIPTLAPTLEPTFSPIQTEEPTIVPTLGPTLEPTFSPIQTEEPTIVPTLAPTLEPTFSPIQTEEPTVIPTSEPTLEPTVTAVQTEEPTLVPTSEPTLEPTLTLMPTEEPTLVPTSEPSTEPTISPVIEPILEPINILAEDSAYYHIESVPSGADVIFDDIGRGPAPVNVTVSTTGVPTHTITLQLPGYQVWSETRPNPAPGATDTIVANLTPLPPNGSISVSSSPTGAMVVLDGSGLQTTPFIFTEVTPGTHTIGISKDGYNSYSATVTVTSGAQATVFAALSPVTSSGSLTVTSNPSGALILLNNIAYGVTPAHFNAIAPGTYNLQLQKPGYQTVSLPIAITPGAETPVNANLQRLIPVTGILTVRSQPSGGTVTLDGVVQGVTPLRITHLLPDSYNLRVSVPGYLSWIGIVHVNAGRETSIFATFAQIQPVTYTGSLSVQSEPSGASVTVDSIPVGKTPLFIRNVAAGTHIIRFEYPGYLPGTTTTQVFPARTRYISSILTKQPVANISSALITLSDDAAVFFKSHGRTESLNAFNNPGSGFFNDGRYVIALDLNGTVLADGGNSSLIGVNLSEQPDLGGVYSGTLMADLASVGGGLTYDTSLARGDPAQVSLVFIRPAINGVIIGTVMPVSEIRYPDSDFNIKELPAVVHNAVLSARENNWITFDTSNDVMRSFVRSDLPLYSFDRTVSDDADIYGVRQSQIMTAATVRDGGYFWVLNRDETGGISLIPGYTEAVDTAWGIWALAKPGNGDLIVMVDMNMIQV